MTALREDLVVAARGPLDRRYRVFTDAALTDAATLSGWTAAAQVRASWRSTTVLHTFTTVVEAQAVRITATGAETAAWPEAWPGLKAVWDIVLTDPGGVLSAPLVGGLITVEPYVTRP